MDVVMERWGYVTPSGAVEPVDLQRAKGRELGEPQWWSAPSEFWRTDAESCVRDVALLRGEDVARVLSPAEVAGIDRVSLTLSRESGRAWLRLLAQWSSIGTLGEPGEELRGELARALGEGGACG